MSVFSMDWALNGATVATATLSVVGQVGRSGILSNINLRRGVLRRGCWS
jgi:hypothetical protein